MGISSCVVVVDIPSSGREFTKNSISSLEPRPFHVGSTALQEVLRTDLHLSKQCFVPTRCSSDEASRPQQQPLIHLFVSLAARTS